MRVDFITVVSALALMLTTAAPSAGILVEATFDDGDDGAGPLTGESEVDNLQNNFSSLGEGYRPIELVGSAHRSAYGDGRYGRGVDLDGDGWVRVSNMGLDRLEDLTTMMWVRLRDLSGCRLVDLAGTVGLAIVDGELVIEFLETGGSLSVRATGAPWPADGGWHHLSFAVLHREGQDRLGIFVDFELATTVDVELQPLPADGEVKLGGDLDGVLDELLMVDREPTFQETWDWDPTVCADGLDCLEEVIDAVPESFPHRVPVRMKSVHDPARCGEQTPCPVVFVISGGGACADSYSGLDNLEYYARDGFVAVTVDPYCEGDNFPVFPKETSQLIAAKEHMLAASPLAAIIDGPEYSAMGCSHGCGAVTAWMMLEEDHPSRTFGNSCAMDWPLCPWAAGELCPAVAEHVEDQMLAVLGTDDLESEEAESFYAHAPIAALTPATVASREFASSWGAHLEGERCTPDGGSNCAEENLWGMTMSSRRVRDIWQRLEPADAPTGYFVENRESNCQHCATVGSAAWKCGACLLKHGRAGMAAACPECLGYDDPTIDSGPPAQPCPIETSWYADPLSAPIGPAGPGSCPGEHRWVVPAGGHLPGEAGTSWVSDLTLANPAPRAAAVSVFLMERDRDNSSMDSISAVVPSRGSVALADLFRADFGRDEVAGGLWICADQALRVMSRTFNDAAAGTFGQGIPALPIGSAIRPGSPGHLIMLTENDAFRTNVGFVNTGPEPVTVSAEMLAADGTSLGVRTYQLSPFGSMQRSRIFTEVGGGPITNAQVLISTDRGEVVAYASVVDNRSGDPTFVLSQ